MKEEYLADFVNLVLRHFPKDRRFTLRGPLPDPHDADIMRWFFDYHGGDAPHGTCPVVLRKSKMVSLGSAELVDYVQDKFLKAHAEILEFTS
jgi:hypothetical protein